jgi:tetratricopeptide (TPR) repeat protein
MFIPDGRRTIVAVLVLTFSAIAAAAESPQTQRPSDTTSPTPTPDHGQAANGEARAFLERASLCVASVEDPEDRVFRLCHMARVQSRHGLRDAAVKTLRQARDAAERVQDPDYRAHRLGDIAACQTEIGDSKAALELVNGLPEIHRDSALRYVSEAQAKIGALDSAAETAAMIRQPIYRGEAFQRIATAYAERPDFASAQRIASGISEPSAQARAWATIAVRQLRAGDRPAAEETLSRATKTTAQIPFDPAEPNDHKAAMMAEIAGVQAEFGNIAGARQTAQEITEAPWQDLAWGNIATAQSNRGDIQAALRAADSIQVSYYRGQAVSAIVAALGQSGDLAAARKLADSIPSDYWRLNAFVVLAKSQIRAGQREAATRLMETVLREADSIKDDKKLPVRGLKRALLYQLAQVQSQAGDWTAASQWIARQSSSDIRTLAYVGLAEGLAAPQQDKGPK